MSTVIFTDNEQETYKVGILIKQGANKEEDLLFNYIEPVESTINRDRFISFSIPNTAKKPTAKDRKEFLDEILPTIKRLGITTLLVADGEYYKTLAKVTKVDPDYGYVKDGVYTGYEGINLAAIPNYTAIFHNDAFIPKISLGLDALRKAVTNNTNQLGADIIKYSDFPATVAEIKKWLDDLLVADTLAIDIEAYSLAFYDARLGTIAFAWDKHEGIAFNVDHTNDRHTAMEIRKLLANFFIKWQGRARWHNGSYDLTVLIYELFMNDLADRRGLLFGLDVMTKNWDDTKIITYLATNSCAGNTLGLKPNSHEFAGNYAEEEIKDINKIEPQRLLTYNLKDSLCTNYVYEKYWQEVIDSNQEDIYHNLLMPSLKNIIHMQLSGFPLNMEKVLEAEAYLTKIRDGYLKTILSDTMVPLLEVNMRRRKAYYANLKYKVKEVDEHDYSDLKFNPNSNKQLQELIYDLHNMPVIDTTRTRAPATGADALEKLLNHTKKPETKKLLEALVGYGKVDKILTSFIPAFKNAKLVDGWYYLYGNYNLGGTLSGRLSSSKPNLQNMPSTGSPYAKVIKECFMAKEGEIFCGLDFNALEVRIDTLLTKDPVKMDVLQAGYDGHSFNAWHYWEATFPPEVRLVKFEEVGEVSCFKEVLPDGKINYYRDETLPMAGSFEPCDYREYNKAKTKLFKAMYGDDERQWSKPVTFALQYKAVPITLVNNSGFSLEEATAIWNNYHKLYKVSTQYTEDRIKRASKDGYITIAFGLRLRTPLLAKCVYGASNTPYIVEEEARTVGNAISQSWGLLNNRAANEVAAELEKPENRWLRENIRPIAHIHDAQYYVVTGNTEVLAELNKLLQHAVNWNDHPEIYHPEVGLGGNLSIFYPNWACELELPTEISSDEIETAFIEHVEAMDNKEATK